MIANLLLYCPHPLKAPIWRELQTIAYTAIWQARTLRKATLSTNVAKTYKTTVGSAYVNFASFPKQLTFAVRVLNAFSSVSELLLDAVSAFGNFVFLLVSLLDPVFVR